ncbi:hypothetical protein M404DRAFT_992038 [Pisolithus tinctorius Marx 270]|uniref:Uncharacterized protein n=1 Tax=Pisolithus tinctorius Marx 270 TaxID=870435 RepID=A0A0C3PXR1_PISTI|nr:hypothetical protein M404DRAFT_992038 [Pisolithus tinctorius Marx 270]
MGLELIHEFSCRLLNRPQRAAYRFLQLSLCLFRSATRTSIPGTFRPAVSGPPQMITTPGFSLTHSPSIQSTSYDMARDCSGSSRALPIYIDTTY